MLTSLVEVTGVQVYPKLANGDFGWIPRCKGARRCGRGMGPLALYLAKSEGWDFQRLANPKGAAL